MRIFSVLLCSFTSLALFPIATTAFDTITGTQTITGNQTIVSAGDVFELGFFTRGSSKKWYLGIWYRNIPTDTVVWVANRDNPLTNSTGVLKIADDGNIVLVDQAANPIWSSNQPTAANTVAQLLDSGNFVLREENDENPENYIWQSFDHPTDTLLPGMKLGWDSKTGLNRYLTSWKSSDDPSSGNYSFKLDINGFPEVYLLNNQVRVYRSGPWNGLRFSGVPEMNTAFIFTFTFRRDQNEEFYSFELRNKSLYSRLLVNTSGTLQRYTWIDESKLWNLFWYAPKDQCDFYLECGVYGVCDTNASPVCNCMTGFEPKNPQAWYFRDGSDGCVRKTELNCANDGFLPLNNMKLPQSSSSFVDDGMSLADCETMCRSNCSCKAYANSNITGGGSGCVIWTTDLLDMRQYAAAEGGQDLYLKVAASDLGQGGSGSGSTGTENGSNKTKVIIMVGPIERSQDFLLNEAVIRSNNDYSGESPTDDLELPLFDFGTIVMATDNFSDANKLGQGGFGCVYKGLLDMLSKMLYSGCLAFE
ncbi:hypothetical protein F0562_014167 [Nyssa sinensis]|uniref:Uncharacterized protein n=1 Tax=Nyssa sinensis TaxID=561372 RepID=A0A5J4ZM36_9ASTE|nr:hypothetical protein F0562_014167 [Nyssa sinensis]